MGRVHSLIPEHSVDREELRGPEAIRPHLACTWDSSSGVCTLALDNFFSISLAFLSSTPCSEFPEHARRGGGGVSAQQ